MPEDSTLVQIGFQYPLNYPFLVAHPLAAAQVFQFLPSGLAYGLDIDASKISMRSIGPYESQSAGFVISVALAYVPSSSVSSLKSQLSDPNSHLFNNPIDSVNSLMKLIDPSIPLFPIDQGSGRPGPTESAGSNSSAKSQDHSNSDSRAGLADSGSLDQPVNPDATVHSKTVGIAVGAVAGAAAYCGAIFLLTRRYRRKKVELEGRSSPALATGGPVRVISPGNGRTPIPINQISEPVMSENSLGWT